MNIIKVDTDLNITLHKFPSGTIGEQKQFLKQLISCNNVEHVLPRRLYQELGMPNKVDSKMEGRMVSMLVDEEFYYRNKEFNLLASWLYETDKHNNPILGDVIFVGECWSGDGVSFCGIDEEVFDDLYNKLFDVSVRMKRIQEINNGGNK